MPLRGQFLLGRRRLAERLGQAHLTEVSERIRRHLDSEQVLRATVEQVHRSLRPSFTGIWLTTGRGDPSLACQRGWPEPDRVPLVVDKAARRRRPAADPRSGAASDLSELAVPIVAPRSGLLGVIYASGDVLSEERQAFLVAVARETGFALETANLYEQAVGAKEKSEAILGRVADAIIVTDAKGRIHEWNRSAEVIIGVSAAEALGRNCAEVLDLRCGERTFECGDGCPLMHQGAERDVSLGVELWRMRPDGRRQPLLANISVVADAEGNVAEIVHSLRDVTRLKEADEAKTMFLATASHELKTPLTVIHGFAQLLASARLQSDADREGAIAAIERRAVELNEIVERVLLSSRIEAGRAEVIRSPVNLEPLVREKASCMAASRGRPFRVEIEEGLPDALADRHAVSTVLDHLLDNAAKYSPGGGDVAVRVESDPDRVRVHVNDSGIGMDADQLGHCFDKFWQAESSDVRRFGGTGIGLYIVASLVEAMGGEVAATSTPGEGTTFSVSLPREGAVPPAPPSPDPLPAGVGEPSIVREFMRQIGIPTR